MKEENLRYVDDFLNNQNIFFEDLNNESVFKKETFHKFTKAVYELSKTELTETQRYKLVILVWEISFKIESLIGRHKDPNDFVSIDNISIEDLHEVGEILFYIANWLSYSKEIEERLTKIGSWKH